jgi:TPR repeat protein
VVNYFKICADHGHPPGAFCYAECFFSGRGVKQDFSVPVRFFKLSADLGNLNATFNYGTCLSRGQGVEKDLTAVISK